MALPIVGSLAEEDIWGPVLNAHLIAQEARIAAAEAAPGGDNPPENDVRLGVDFDNATQTGNLVLPTAAQVEDGVGFGANGTEFTGTFVGGGGTPSTAIVGPDGAAVVGPDGSEAVGP